MSQNAADQAAASGARRHPIQVVVLGAGPWGRNLIRTFHELGALAAVVETDPATRQQIRELYPHVTVLEEAAAAWQTPWPAVVIATPVPTHFDLARQALAANKHVFVEKPLSLTTGEAGTLVRLAKQAERTLMVGHLLLYQPAIGWVQEQLAAGLIGQVLSLHQERLNWGRVRAAENALWSLGVHDIAVLLHLVGRSPARIWASGQRMLQPTIDDDVRVELAFDNGVRAHLHCSWLWPEKRRRLTIIGTTGMLVYDELPQTVTLHRKSIGPGLVAHDKGAAVVFTGAGQPLQLECEHFLEVIRTGRQPLSDGASGVEVVSVLERAQAQLMGNEPSQKSITVR